MAVQNYATEAARIGKFKGALLARAIPVEVLNITGTQKPMPRNNSDTYVARRWLPKGGTTAAPNTWSVDPLAHQTVEGVTPTAETIVPQDITVVMLQYSCLYMYTDKTADFYEDDVPKEMVDITGERMGLCREMVTYGTLKACSNKFYAGGTSRSTVADKVSLNLLRKVEQSLFVNLAKPITEVLAASTKISTAPAGKAYLVFVHTDVANDIKNIPGFVHYYEYGTKEMVHENEIGFVDSFRFVVSPHMSPYLAAGAAVGSTGMYAANATNIDVYPMIMVARDAWVNVAMRGANAITPTHLPANQKTKDDPLGQRGYVGATFWAAPFISNDFWMAVIESARTSL